MRAGRWSWNRRRTRQDVTTAIAKRRLQMPLAFILLPVRKENSGKLRNWGLSLPTGVSPAETATSAGMENLEAISFKEEAEQALIEDSVELDPMKDVIWAKLPFIEDPVTSLKPNRFVAEKVLKTQLELFRKNPSMREDTVNSHQKLVDRGHVSSEDELPADKLEVVRTSPGDEYFIPWRTVYNEGSLSTPCRMVFDASSKTPGGNSLNGVLANGQNRLCKLQHLLVRFRRGRQAVTADISMA
jgi:hypothetical protein